MSEFDIGSGPKKIIIKREVKQVQFIVCGEVDEKKMEACPYLQKVKAMGFVNPVKSALDFNNGIEEVLPFCNPSEKCTCDKIRMLPLEAIVGSLVTRLNTK